MCQVAVFRLRVYLQCTSVVHTSSSASSLLFQHPAPSCSASARVLHGTLTRSVRRFASTGRLLGGRITSASALRAPREASGDCWGPGRASAKNGGGLAGPALAAGGAAARRRGGGARGRLRKKGAGRKALRGRLRGARPGRDGALGLPSAQAAPRGATSSGAGELPACEAASDPRRRPGASALGRHGGELRRDGGGGARGPPGGVRELPPAARARSSIRGPRPCGAAAAATCDEVVAMRWRLRARDWAPRQHATRWRARHWAPRQHATRWRARHWAPRQHATRWRVRDWAPRQHATRWRRQLRARHWAPRQHGGDGGGGGRRWTGEASRTSWGAARPGGRARAPWRTEAARVRVRVRVRARARVRARGAEGAGRG